MTSRTRTLVASAAILVLAGGVSSMQHARVPQAGGTPVPPLISESQAPAPPATAAPQGEVMAAQCQQTIARTTGADVKAGSDAPHHMTVPSRAQGAGLVARGQMQHLIESMRSAMRQSAEVRDETACPCIERTTPRSR